MSDEQSAPATIRFDGFELDAASGDLRKDGLRFKLQTQPLQVLTALLARPGGVVTRDALRQRLWPDDTFVDFEHGLNAAVKRLRDTLGDSADNPRYIETLPRRGYRFIAAVEPTVTPLEAAKAPAPGRRPAMIAVVAIAAIVVGAPAAWFIRTARAGANRPPARVVALTTMEGFEAGSLSPDGRQMAFEWGGDRGDNQDIYVGLIGSAETRRLTTDRALDRGPTWSHSGLQIAYVRELAAFPSSESTRARVMSALGGADREVSDLPVSVPARWSPDDRYLVAARAPQAGEAHPDAGIYLIPVQGGDVRRLTRPVPPEIHRAPVFAPDGRRLAFISCEDTTHSACHLEVADVDASLAPRQPARRLPSQPLASEVMGITWSSDGASLIYGAYGLSALYLWRVDASGARPPERLDVAGGGAAFPSMQGDRLTFSRFLRDVDIYRYNATRAAEPIARSSVFDGNVQFTPDGRRILFCSQRTDAVEAWVANADGSSPRQLTHGPNEAQCSPVQSPRGDGRIVFDSRSPDGSYHVWTVDQDGGSPRQITSDAGDQNNPTWSHDGEWIYFAWKPQGVHDMWARDIWRTRVATGVKARVTTTGHAVVGRESMDGSTLYYQSRMPTGALMAQPLAGGGARPLVACVYGSAFAITGAGVFYLPCEGHSFAGATLRRLDPTSGDDRQVATLEKYLFGWSPGAFTVSPDGHTILYEREVRSGADLMMIDHFK